MRGGLLALSLLLAAVPTAHADRAADARHSATAGAIEARLVAPCCWTQTLDVHDSELAADLRTEIQRRVTAGESPEAIEDGLAARYGERIRAVPRGRDPFAAMASAVYVAMGAALLLLVLVASRWVRRGRRDDAPERGGPTETGELDRYRARVDEEVARLEEA